jgi:hypothetical protein
MTDLEPGVVVSPDTAAAMERLNSSSPKRTMNEQHSPVLSAYLDIVDNLCARVEALEATQFRSWHPQGGKGHLKIAVETTYGTSLTPSPAGSLVERVAGSHMQCSPEIAITAIAAELDGATTPNES